MRRKLTDFVGVLMLIVIIVCSVGAVSNLLENKESDWRYASFFTEEQAVDVLLIGSSHMRHGVFPMELWRTRGIAEKSRVWKGAMPLSGVVERKEHKYKEMGDGSGAAEAGEQPVYDEQSREYLEKIIDLCDDRGIRLILVNTGFDCSDEAKLFHDSVVDIAADKGVPYYDFTKEDFIDFGTDLNSTGHNTHVNFSGAEKMSERVGDILAEAGSLQDHRGEAAYEQWRADCEAFIAGKHEYLKEQEDLENYLMFLYDDDYRVLFDVREDSLLGAEKARRLVANLGERVEAWTADDWDEVYWGAEALDLEPSDDADLIIAVYSKHDGKVVDVRGFNTN